MIRLHAGSLLLTLDHVCSPRPLFICLTNSLAGDCGAFCLNNSHSFVDVHGQRGRVDLDEEHARPLAVWLRVVQTCERYAILTVEIGEVALQVIPSDIDYRENASVGAFVADGHAVAFVAVAVVQIDNEQERTLFICDDVVALITQGDVLETIDLDVYGMSVLCPSLLYCEHR